MEEKLKPKNRKAAFVRLVGYLKPHRQSVGIGVLSNIGVGLVALIPPLIFKALTDRVILNSHGSMSSRCGSLTLCVVGLLLAYSISAILSYVRNVTMHILGERIILHLRKEVYTHLQALSVSYFDSRQTGEIMSRVTNDSEAVEEFVIHAADTVIADAMRVVAMCVIMLMISTKLALVALVPVPFILFKACGFTRRIRPMYRSIRERLAEMNAKIQENITGIRVIKAFSREDHEYGNFENDVNAYFDMRVQAIRTWTKFFPSIELIVSADTILFWAVGSILVMKGQTTMGTLVMFSMYMQMFHAPVGNLVQINDVVQRSLAAAERIFEVVDEEPLIKDSPDAVELPRIEGRVQFESVNFGYEDGDEVLKDICIKTEPGQIVALVGKSGAGKTSIVNLIPRFYDPISGRVLIDSYDVKHVRQDSLRRQIAMVLQDTFLFNGTIKDNIRYGKLDATDDEITEAAKAANAHEFIKEMSNGYDTEIGERGIKLSGGQKQRMAIARAILADPRILILDEATSSVDSESEYLIHRAMDRLMEGRTTFVIAHRLSTIKHADQIITLEHGRVSEVGDHKSLLEQDGTYSQMYAMQFRLDEELSEGG